MLMIALIAMSLLMGVLVLFVARGERHSASLRWWGWGLVSYAFGMLMILAFVVPWDIRQVLGNALISLAAMLTSLAVFQHTNIRPGRRLMLAGLAIAVAPLVINHLLHEPWVIVDIGAPTLYATVLYLIASWAMLRRPPPAAREASRFLVLTIIGTLIIWNARFAAIWVSLGGTSDADRTDFSVSVFAIAQMLLIVSSTLGLMWVEVRLMEADLERAAYTDLLTGLPNRRAMLLRFKEEKARAGRQQQKFAVVLFDIDNFKQINDTCGHYIGDQVLIHITETLNSAKRAEDVLGRIGGEEFLVILPHHEREVSVAAAERLRRAVEAATPHQDVGVPAATVSGGVAVYPDDGDDWDRLFMAADRRMYHAKRAGRNRVEGLDAPQPA
jgi:diguanylate cyclase (GGDEF)-like protein